MSICGVMMCCVGSVSLVTALRCVCVLWVVAGIRLGAYILAVYGIRCKSVWLFKVCDGISMFAVFFCVRNWSSRATG